MRWFIGLGCGLYLATVLASGSMVLAHGGGHGGGGHGGGGHGGFGGGFGGHHGGFSGGFGGHHGGFSSGFSGGYHSGFSSGIGTHHSGVVGGSHPGFSTGGLHHSSPSFSGSHSLHTNGLSGSGVRHSLNGTSGLHHSPTTGLNFSHSTGRGLTHQHVNTLGTTSHTSSMMNRVHAASSGSHHGLNGLANSSTHRTLGQSNSAMHHVALHSNTALTHNLQNARLSHQTGNGLTGATHHGLNGLNNGALHHTGLNGGVNNALHHHGIAGLNRGNALHHHVLNNINGLHHGFNNGLNQRGFNGGWNSWGHNHFYRNNLFFGLGFPFFGLGGFGFGYGYGYPWWLYGYGYGYPWYGGFGYGGYGYGYNPYCSYAYYGGNGFYGVPYVNAYAAAPTTVATNPVLPAVPQSVDQNADPDKAAIESAEQFARQGEADFKAGHYPAAVHAWRHSVVDNPKNGVVVMMLAQALFATGKFDEAAGATQQAMLMLPPEQWGVVVTNYTELYTNIQDYTDQLRALEKAMKEKSDSPALRFLLGFHYGYLGYPRDAVVQLEKLKELAPNDEMGAKLLEVMSAKLPKPADAAAPEKKEE